jgi:hypothetical protein
MGGNHYEIDTFLFRKSPNFICRMTESDHRDKFYVRANMLLNELAEGLMGFSLTPEVVTLPAIHDVQKEECRRIQQPEGGGIFHGCQRVFRQVGGDQNLTQVDQGSSGDYIETVYQAPCQHLSEADFREGSKRWEFRGRLPKP